MNKIDENLLIIILRILNFYEDCENLVEYDNLKTSLEKFNDKIID